MVKNILPSYYNKKYTLGIEYFELKNVWPELQNHQILR